MVSLNRHPKIVVVAHTKECLEFSFVPSRHTEWKRARYMCEAKEKKAYNFFSLVSGGWCEEALHFLIANVTFQSCVFFLLLLILRTYTCTLSGTDKNEKHAHTAVKKSDQGWKWNEKYTMKKYENALALQKKAHKKNMKEHKHATEGGKLYMLWIWWSGSSSSGIMYVFCI